MSLEIPFAGSGEDPIVVSEVVFGREYNESLVHQLVIAYLASARKGTKAQKTRSEVNGGGAKPWRQKGTGRARAGSSRNPLWRSGGVTFAACQRSYEQKLNRKMYRGAMRSIFSELLRQGRLVMARGITPIEPKSKLLAEKLKELGVTRGVLITDSLEPNLYLAARNLPNFDVCRTNAINPAVLVDSDTVFLTVEAARKIEALLS